MTRALDAGRVRALLRPDAVLDAYGVPYARRGHELRTRLCPACGPRSRDAVCINAESGHWICHRCSAKGDAFALVGGLAGLDVRANFPAVLEMAASLVGFDPSDERSTALPRAESRPGRVADDERRAAAVVAMRETWSGLAGRSAIGELYLRARGIEPLPLISCGVLRFHADGRPAVAARDLESGAVVGIQYRRTDGSEPKIESAWGSRFKNAALCGRLDELDREGVDVGVITEGLADSLVAHHAFSGCAVYGAAGATHMPTIARVVARRVRVVRGWLLVVADDDENGVKHAADAVREAKDEGLVLDRDLLLVDLGEHHDLADAWRSGWRYAWPRIAAGHA